MNSELLVGQMRGMKSKVYFKLRSWSYTFRHLPLGPRNLNRKGLEGGGCARRSRSQLCPGATFLAGRAFLPWDTRDAGRPHLAVSLGAPASTPVNPQGSGNSGQGVFLALPAVRNCGAAETGREPIGQTYRKSRRRNADTRLSIADRTSQSLKPTIARNRPPKGGSFCNSVLRTWCASALRIRATVSATNWYR